MITLATTAAVLATGAFLVLKQPQADAENAPQSQNSAQESQATSAAKQSGPLNRSEAEIASQRLPEGRAGRGNPLSGPSNDAKTTAQGIPSGASQVRTTPPAVQPAKPVLVAQANTTPKLGQAADEKAVPRPDHRTDPAKWVMVNPEVDFWANKGLEKKGDAWVIGKSRLRSKRAIANCAIRVRLDGPLGLAQGVALRIGDAGFYQLEIKGKDVLLLRVNTTADPFKYEHLKRFEGAVANIPAEGVVLGFSAIGDELKAWLGEKELGSFIDSTYKDGNFGCVAAEAVTFRDIEYQILDDTTSPAAVVAQAPAPPAAPPAVTLPPELTTLQQQYDKLLVERVTGIYDADVAKLNTGYLAGLDRAAATAQSAGELDTVLALTAEKKRLEAKQPVPATDDAGTPAALKNLRTIYRTSLAKLDEQRTANHTALLTPYATRLQQIEADLTKAGRIPDAVAVKTYREGLETNPAPTAPVAPAASTPMKETPAPTASKTKEPSKNIKGDDRKAAEWVLSLGGRIVILDGAQERSIRSLDQLPKGRLEVLGIELQNTDGKLKPFTEADFEVIGGLQSLYRISLYKVELGPSAIAILSTCPKLDDVYNHFGDAGWEQFARISGLNKLSQGYEGGAITGVGAGSLSKVPLEELTITASKPSDEAMAEIAQIKTLKALSLDGGNVTDAGIKHLSALKDLQSLNVRGNAVTIEGLQALKNLPITRLGFGSNMNDVTAGIAEAARLFPKLEDLALPRDVSPTPDDWAIIGKALPKLKRVFIRGDKFGDSSCTGIASLQELVSIEIFSGAVTGEGISRFSGLKKLAALFLNGTKVADDVLPVLTKMKNLKKVTLPKSTISAAALADFKRQRPDLKVD